MGEKERNTVDHIQKQHRRRAAVHFTKKKVRKMPKFLPSLGSFSGVFGPVKTSG